MEAVKQLLKIPKNHEVKIPDYITEDSSAEVINIFNKKETDRFKQLN